MKMVTRADECVVEEELLDKPATTNGTWFDFLQSFLLPFLVRCGFLTAGPVGRCTHDLRRASRAKELRVFLREASLSRLNPIL